MFFLDLSNFTWCSPTSGIVKALTFVKAILNIIRFIVPVGLIAYTSYEMIKKVINPDDKDFMKRIINRVIAAVVVFFVPTIISLSLRLIDMVRGTTDAQTNSLGECWNLAGK